MEQIEEVKERLEGVVSDKGYVSPQVSITKNGGGIEIYVLGFKSDTWYECRIAARDYSSAPTSLETAIKSNMMVPYKSR